jgi:mannan endo-1,6-alpha-mannosidase
MYVSPLSLSTPSHPEQTNGSSVWKERVQGVLNSTNIFFKNGIMYEQACEDVGTTGDCDTDQQSFKAYLSRWMAASTKIAPFTASYSLPLLASSAKAAALQCDGGSDGTTCGEHWTDNGTYDGIYGLGQQMSALSVIQSQLIGQAPELVTNSTGGTSVGNAAAGSGSSGGNSATVIAPATGADRAGAGILTAAWIAAALGGVCFMVTGT